MPGSRLTTGERRKIEEALAGGTGFAAIGRQLNRPAGTAGRRERPAGQRREHYVVDDGMWLNALADSIRTNTMWAETARQGSELLGRDSPAGVRLHRLAVFFADLNGRVTGAARAAVAADAVTVAAALAHAGRPLAPSRLAGALGWPAGRLRQAVRLAVENPAVTGPLTVRTEADGLVAVTANQDRLTIAQLAELDAISG